MVTAIEMSQWSCRFSGWLLTTGARVWFQGSPCGIRGEQSGSGYGFFPVCFIFPLSTSFPTHISFVHHGRCDSVAKKLWRFGRITAYNFKVLKSRIWAIANWQSPTGSSCGLHETSAKMVAIWHSRVKINFVLPRNRNERYPQPYLSHSMWVYLGAASLGVFPKRQVRLCTTGHAIILSRTSCTLLAQA